MGKKWQMPLPLKSGIDMSKRQKKTYYENEWMRVPVHTICTNVLYHSQKCEWAFTYGWDHLHGNTFHYLSSIKFCKESIQSANFCQTVAEWSHPFQLHEENLSN